MESILELKSIIEKVKNDIKLIKTNEFNKVWANDSSLYNTFMLDLHCVSVKYHASNNKYVCQIKLDYLTEHEVLIEIHTTVKESQSISVFMNGILEYEQDMRVSTHRTYERDCYFKNFGRWALTLPQVREAVDKAVHIIDTNELIKS